MSEFTFNYSLGDKARLFDLGQGINAGVTGIIKNRGGKAQPFTRSLKKMKVQALVFGLLALAQTGLMAASGVSVLKIAMAALCALMGGTVWAAQTVNKKAFGRAQQMYLENKGQSGSVTVDEDGFVECSDSGAESRFEWEDYRCTVLCEEAIVVVTFRPVMMILSRTEETEDGLLTALAAFDRLDSVYEVEIREKKK